MNNAMAQDFFKGLLDSVVETDEGTLETNPGLSFNVLARQGKLESLTDADYDSCLHATNEIAALWHQNRELPLSEITSRALSACSLSDADRDLVSDVLAQAWVRNHQDEDHVHGSDGQPDKGEDPYVRMPYRYFVQAQGPAGNRPLEGLSPRQIAERLSRRVWGQEAAVRDLAIMLWHHARGNRRVTLLMGPTGSGKTLLANQISQMWPTVCWIDGSQVTQEGWSGSVKLADAFNGMTQQEAERAIVIIDEADKMFEPHTSSSGENVSAAVQTGLLKMMDGGHTRVRLNSGSKADTAISTEHVSFLLMGTFESTLAGMSHEHRSAGFAADNRSVDDGMARLPTAGDLERYGGVRHEIAGRVNTITRVSALTAEDYLSLLRDPLKSPAVRLGIEYGTEVELTDEECRAMAEEAASSEMGVRSIESQIQRRLDRKLWEDELAPVAAADTAGQERPDSLPL